MSTDTSRQDRLLTADIVRFTRRSARRYRRSQSSWGDRFVDAYSWGLGIGVSLTIAASFVLALRNEIASRASTSGSIIREQWLVLPEPVLWTCLTFVVLLAVGNLARKLGPLAVNGPESSWWLPFRWTAGPWSCLHSSARRRLPPRDP